MSSWKLEQSCWKLSGGTEMDLRMKLWWAERHRVEFNAPREDVETSAARHKMEWEQNTNTHFLFFFVFFSISIGLFRSIQYIENSDILHHVNVWETVHFSTLPEVVTYKTLIIRCITYKVHNVFKVYTNGLFPPLHYTMSILSTGQKNKMSYTEKAFFSSRHREHADQDASD